MRNLAILGLYAALAATGCARASTLSTPRTATSNAPGGQGSEASAPIASANGEAAAADGPSSSASSAYGIEPADRRTGGSWIGAASEGSILASGTRETFVGVWVDVPDQRPEVRPPLDLALVVDTSGSMAGAKIENARAAASMIVKSLRDGDIVALDAFSDTARTIVPPTRIDALTRAEILRSIAHLTPSGSTNMFEGLSLAEGHVAAAPSTHSLRRIVMISDGIANVGPSSPQILGELAERGLRFRAQVTSLGVGNDYDERTLNALAMKSSGRLYHLSDAKEMASVMKGELDLLNATLASEAFVEIVPAPGVQLVTAEGVRATWETGGAMRLPLGALHAGQHREALVRVRITDPASFEGHARPVASVRLRFRDAQDNDIERIQEVVARTTFSSDRDAVARGSSSRAKAIAAIQDAANVQLAMAQRVNDGALKDAEEGLRAAERRLTAQAQQVSGPEKKRLENEAGRIAAARTATAAAAAAPKAVQRGQALKLNADAMQMSGF